MASKISRRQTPRQRNDGNFAAMIGRINPKPTPAPENPGNIFATSDPTDITPPLSPAPKIQPN
jgi:hypothetical protein